MLITIIILGVLLFISAAALLFLTIINKYLLSQIYSPELYPCQLWLTVHYNAKESKTITDFSRYDKHKIITVVEYIPRPPKDVIEEYMDGTLIINDYGCVYNALGRYFWKGTVNFGKE